MSCYGGREPQKGLNISRNHSAVGNVEGEFDGTRLGPGLIGGSSSGDRERNGLHRHFGGSNRQNFTTD